MPQLSPAPATTPRSTQDQNYRNPTTHSLAGQFSIPQTPNGSTDPYISGKFPAISTPPPSSPPGSPTPYRIKQDAVGMHLLNQGGFSRLHLRLYLLIDGQRNIFELIRLMRRPAEEIQQLLHDLRHLGVIYY
jgi:hypothetical protein